jgi:hypothetical protein
MKKGDEKGRRIRVMMMAKVGESGQPISKIREAVKVVRSANLNGTLRGGQPVFNIMGRLPSF